jgi:effector-binding domain-containing protein
MAEYQVRTETVASRALAAARGAASRAALGDTIHGLLNLVWPVLRAQGVRTGHNVVLYPSGGVLNIVAGVEVLGPFTATADVQPASTPAGDVATTTYWGDYALMSPAYDALTAWCTAHHRRQAGPSWEVYGDWDEDPQKLRTDIYFLLEPAPDGPVETQTRTTV